MAGSAATSAAAPAAAPAADRPAAGPARPLVVVVTGPTASGKSALAQRLAEAFDGVVINGDSMQLYRELAILTARPGPDALARVPHRLYGVLAGTEAASAGRWRAWACDHIDRALGAGRLPIVVGGTGLYLKALEHGLARLPSIPAAVRAAARRRHERIGGPAFHAELAARDPVMAARLHPGDTQRLIRAQEVLTATGRSLADWQGDGRPPPAPYDFLTLALMPPRAELYRAADARFRAMVAAGAVAEARALLALGLDPAQPVMKALGLCQLAQHLAGEISLEEAILGAQRMTRRYAKRQMTWLRTQRLTQNPAPIVFEAQFLERMGAAACKIVQSYRLTG